METNSFKNIWVEVEGILTPKSKNELKDILISKTKKAMNKFKFNVIISILICIGVLIFLTLASLKLKDDLYYLINNSILFVVIMIYLYYYIKSYRKLNEKANGEYSVYKMLQKKVQFIEKGMKSKSEYVMLPLLSLLLIISINVYYTSGSVLGIIENEENIIGLIFGLIIGIVVAWVFMKKMKKYFNKELKIMKNYMKEIEAI